LKFCSARSADQFAGDRSNAIPCNIAGDLAGQMSFRQHQPVIPRTLHQQVPRVVGHSEVKVC